VQAIKEELEEIAHASFAAVPATERDLHAVMVRRAMPVERAKALGRLRFEELFG
jgi:hypothetical protein